MKISAYISIILVVGVVFFIFAMMGQEAATNYPAAGINSSAVVQYDYSVQINNSIAPMQSAMQSIESSDTGWFSKITSGLAAIPYAVILIPRLLFNSIVYGGAITSGVFMSLGTPTYIILVVLIMIVVWAVLKSAEVYQRWPI